MHYFIGSSSPGQHRSNDTFYCPNRIYQIILIYQRVFCYFNNKRKNVNFCKANDRGRKGYFIVQKKINILNDKK